MTALATASTLEIRQVRLADMFASPGNPRRSIDEAQLAELAASIASVGVQVPLLLRATSGAALEICCGERRARAAQLAGLETVPAIVCVMTDEGFRQAQLVDNLQRADLSPIDEAVAYAEIMRLSDLPVEVLAAKVGKTVPYCLQRMRLLALIPEAREAMQLRVLNLGLALLVARLQIEDQKKATLYAIDPKRITKGADLAARIADAAERIRKEEGWYRCATERELRDWIASNTLLQLKGVSWDLNDAALVPGAGACTNCPKRTGNAVALFGDMGADADTCTDPACFAAKTKAAVKVKLAESNAVKLLTASSHLPLKEGATAIKKGQWLEAKKGSCTDVIEGVTDEGKLLRVCANQKCKVHKHRVDEPMKKGATSRDWEAERKTRQAKEAAYLKEETPLRRAVWAAIRPKLVGPKLQRLILDTLIDSANTFHVFDLRGIEREEDYSQTIAAVKDSELEDWIIDVLGAERLFPMGYMFDRVKPDRENLWELAKRVGVDADKIVAQALLSAGEAARSAADPKPASQKPAAKKVAKAPGAKLSAVARARVRSQVKKAVAKKKGARR